MYKKIALTCLLPLALHATTESQGKFVFHSPKIGPATAVLTTSAGIGAGLLSYYLLSLLTQSHVKLSTAVPFTDSVHGKFSLPANLSEHLTPLIAAAAGIFGGWLAFSYRPEGLFIAARNNLSTVINDHLINELITTGENVLQNIDTKYIESAHSRIDAYNDFSAHYIALKNAAEWLRSSIASSNDVALVDAAQSYLVIIQEYMAQIADCISIIKSDPNWFKQLKCYEMTKSREAQEQLVIATRMASMDSHSHHVYVHNT